MEAKFGEAPATTELRERLKGFQEQRELMKRQGFFRDEPTLPPQDRDAQETQPKE